eukprot:scaffold197426_cov34-Tisochrysis_lutea.AAC.1
MRKAWCVSYGHTGRIVRLGVEVEYYQLRKRFKSTQCTVDCSCGQQSQLAHAQSVRLVCVQCWVRLIEVRHAYRHERERAASRSNTSLTRSGAYRAKAAARIGLLALLSSWKKSLAWAGGTRRIGGPGRRLRSMGRGQTEGAPAVVGQPSTRSVQTRPTIGQGGDSPDRDQG